MLRRIFAMVLLVAALCNSVAFGCSLLKNTNAQGTFVGRTMEWWGALKTRLCVVPRNHDMTDASGYRWVTKYGMLTTEEEGIANADGINEKGLTAHLLYQEDSVMPAIDKNKPALSSLNLVAFLLSNCASVSEALQVFDKYAVLPAEGMYHGKMIRVPLHVALNDASGDTAIVEWNDGKLQVHHGKNYNVMTNEPRYDKQLANLNKVKKEKDYYRIEQLPGGCLSTNRFVRLSFFMEKQAAPVDAAQAVMFMEQAIDNVLAPATTASATPQADDGWPARYRIVYDLKNMNVYFDQDETGKQLYLKMSQLDFAGKDIRYLDPLAQQSRFDLQ